MDETESRPTSVSGYSMSGASYSGEDSFSALSPQANYRRSSEKLTVDDDGGERGGKAKSKNKSHSRKKAPGHVNRPRNAFILFRSHTINNDLIPTSFGVKDNRAISCIVASLWNSLPMEEKDQWKYEAEKEKEWHRLQYPDYQFRPDAKGYLSSSPSSRSKPRKNAKPEKGQKEKCELIAEQILKAHGRIDENQAEEAKRRKAAAASKKGSRVRTDNLPKARKSTKAVKRKEVVQPQSLEEEDDAEAEYKAPAALTGRRRSSSLPSDLRNKMSTHPDGPTLTFEPNHSHFSSWQTRLEEVERTRQGSRGEQQDVDLADVKRESGMKDLMLPPLHSFSDRREGFRPAPLAFAESNHLHIGDTSLISPRTTLSTSMPPIASPRYLQTLLHNRAKPSTPLASPRLFAPFQRSDDAMLLSPIKSVFRFDHRRSSSVTWPAWPRLSTSDFALPPLRTRQSSSCLSPPLYHSFTSFDTATEQHLGEDNDDLFAQAARAANVSLHHEIISPTLESYHDRCDARKKAEAGSEAHGQCDGLTGPSRQVTIKVEDQREEQKEEKEEEEEEEEVYQLDSDSEEDEEMREDVARTNENLNFDYLALHDPAP
ncbi:hypothetical protein CBS101457_004380 [Exobasidium rhododendri]|nr:hypothetical protein CBS101457_004380 [Exobasidium rhododendri]